jgi:hypothetical protein
MILNINEKNINYLTIASDILKYANVFIIFRTNMKLIDESETDIEEDTNTVINNVHDYHSVFKPNRTCKSSNLL